MFESPIVVKTAKSNEFIELTPAQSEISKSPFYKYDELQNNQVKQLNAIRNEQNELSLPDKSVNQSLGDLKNISAMKSEGNIQFTNQLEFDKSLLKDIFDKEFILKLKEEINQNKYGVDNPDRAKIQHFSKLSFGPKNLTSIPTNTNTPNTHTPVRSPQLRGEALEEEKEEVKISDNFNYNSGSRLI